MKEAVEYVGGRFSLESAPSSGTRIYIEFDAQPAVPAP